MGMYSATWKLNGGHKAPAQEARLEHPPFRFHDDYAQERLDTESIVHRNKEGNAITKSNCCSRHTFITKEKNFKGIWVVGDTLCIVGCGGKMCDLEA